MTEYERDCVRAYLAAVADIHAPNAREAILADWETFWQDCQTQASECEQIWTDYAEYWQRRSLDQQKKEG